MTWSFLGQTLAGGILLGGIYALLASSVTLIFGVMRVINFAQADFMMLGMALAFALNYFFGLDPIVMAIPVGLALALAGLPVAGVLERVPRGNQDAQLILTLGVSQLQRLEEFVERRNAIARRYDEALRGVAVVTPTVRQDRRSSFHLYVVRLPGHDPARHRRVFEAMRAAGIGVNLHYMPVHLQPDFRHLGFAEGMFPESENYAQSAISLPMFPALTDEDQDRVVEALRSSLGA